jgi:hypothetical protein
LATVVDDAVQRGFGSDGWIWISNCFAEGYPTRFFMNGWDSALHWVIRSRENKCRFMLPLPEELSPRGHVLELQLHLALPEANSANAITIGVRVDLSTDDEI